MLFRQQYSTAWVGIALVCAFSVGILGRGYWTPDEPREADLAWRMSWQVSKAVPLLAGEAFCEKPPFTYWVAGASIRLWGDAAWAARLPNLLYALVTALAVGILGRRSAGPIAGVAAAAAVSSFLLSYQVAIWLATDAPLLAAVSVALVGLYAGFYAAGPRERVLGYSCMHAALAVGFLSKSAAAWMVPVVTLGALVAWERRWRELLRWELYIGLLLQAAFVLTWVGAVYWEPNGADHLKVFFWNNLVGRFAHVDAPEELQYTSGHRNSPGKYLLELPVYLWPWTLLVGAAARRAWQQRRRSAELLRPVRFAAAAFLPTMLVLSVAATARNIYLAPALPGLALLLGWWAADIRAVHDRWDRRAVRATAALLVLAAVLAAVAIVIVAQDSGDSPAAQALLAALSTIGLSAALWGAVCAWRAAGRDRLPQALFGLLLAYSALLVGPASQLYRRIDPWQDLASIGRNMGRDASGRPLILFAPDETTRAFVDMYTRTSVDWVPGPINTDSSRRLDGLLQAHPTGLVITQLPGRSTTRTLNRLAEIFMPSRRIAPAPPLDAVSAPAWAADLQLHIAYRYALPNGRRYALLSRESNATSR